MKDWLEKLKAARAGPWLLLLLGCLALFLLLPQNALPAASMTEEEARISAALSRIAGAGETRVSIYYAQAASALGGSRQAVGAVVISRGAQDLRVRLDLQRAAEALLGLESRQVEIFVMEDGA